jgi:hypothetical protein
MKITRRSTQILIEDYVYNDKLEKDLSVYDFLKKDFVFSSFFKRDENTILIPASFPIEEYCEEEIIEDSKCIRPKKIDFELYQPIRPESVSLEAFNARNAEQDVIADAIKQYKKGFRDGRNGYTLSSRSKGFREDAKEILRRKNKEFCKMVLDDEDYDKVKEILLKIRHFN